VLQTRPLGFPLPDPTMSRAFPGTTCLQNTLLLAPSRCGAQCYTYIRQAGQVFNKGSLGIRGSASPLRRTAMVSPSGR